MTYKSAPTTTEFLTHHFFPFVHIPTAQSLIDRIGVRGYPLNVFLGRHHIIRRFENGIPTEWKSDKDIIAGNGTDVAAYLRTLLI